MGEGEKAGEESGELKLAGPAGILPLDLKTRRFRRLSHSTQTCQHHPTSSNPHYDNGIRRISALEVRDWYQYEPKRLNKLIAFLAGESQCKSKVLKKQSAWVRFVVSLYFGFLRAPEESPTVQDRINCSYQ